MSWEKTTVGEIVTTRKGYAFKSSEYVNKGVPVVRVSDYTMDSISDADLKYYPYDEKQNYIDYELHEKDVIVQTVGSWQNNPASVVGKVVRVPYFLEGALLNQNAVKIMPAEGIDNNFLFYRLKTEEFKGHVLGEARGAANQASITLDTIKSFDFLIPDCLTQKKIGNILSKYDELIENNRKQIKLLEEAAQRLYKEWFVDLRFPGYENCKIVDGVPEGWSKDRADNFFKITIGKTPPRAEKQWFVDGSVGVPWLSISDMGKAGVYVFNTSEGLTSDAVQKYNMKVVPAGTVFLSFKLTIGRVAIAIKDMCTNEAIAHFCIENDKLRAYTYCYLSNFEYDTLGNTSSISKAVNSKIIKAMPFVMPNDGTIEKFSNVVDPILNEIKVKQEICNELIEARDRLLPKLMSGEVEV